VAKRQRDCDSLRVLRQRNDLQITHEVDELLADVELLEKESQNCR
jgi:hypothetical protein